LLVSNKTSSTSSRWGPIKRRLASSDSGMTQEVVDNRKGNAPFRNGKRTHFRDLGLNPEVFILLRFCRENTKSSFGLSFEKRGQNIFFVKRYYGRLRT